MKASPPFPLAPIAALLLLGAPAAAPSAWAQARVVVAGQDGVDAPKRTRTVQPVYPQEALVQGIRGIVILELLIDPDGKVVSADVIRSVPGLDEAALAAVRKWEYATTKVDGQPVSVRLTVPITFALKVPDVTRGPGIPELRQGVAVAYPAGQTEAASVAAEVVLAPDGQVAESEVLKGSGPFTAALLAALRTWRFAPQSDDVVLSFRVEADFIPARDGAARVEVKLTGLRRSEGTPMAEAPAPAPPGAPPTTSPAATPPVAPPAVAPPTSAPAAPTPTPQPTPQGPPRDAPPATASPLMPPSAPSTPSGPTSPPPTAPPTTAPPATAPPATTPPPSTPPGPRPAGPATTPAPSTPAPTTPAPSTPPPPTGPAAAPPSRPPSAPPVEVITAPPPPGAPAAAPTPPPPVEPGVSAIKDVTLAIGVPDLVRGRRPVPAPIARMSGVTGAVEVRFTVDAAGNTSVQDVNGPEPLKAGAAHTVGSWVFRRVSAERLFLVAALDYASETAKATVQPQP
jgi:TonB family protein